MELLSLVNEMQSEEYVLRQRRESLKHICGYELTDYQIGVLMSENANNSQTIYAAQERSTGTSTALLLKVYQSIFLENKLNDKYIISRGNNLSAYMKNQMMNLLGRANLLQHVRRDSRYRIELTNGCVIHFENSNPQNLRGMSTGPEIFFDDYMLQLTSDIGQPYFSANDEMHAVLNSSFPTHTHYFLASEDFNNEFTQVLFNM